MTRLTSLAIVILALASQTGLPPPTRSPPAKPPGRTWPRFRGRGSWSRWKPRVTPFQPRSSRVGMPSTKAMP